jgi:hypothetical protein
VSGPVVSFRPLGTWPGPRTASWERTKGPFQAGYQDTIAQLRHELAMLDARAVVIELALSEEEIRRDGLPRTHARPGSPGVAVSFTCRWGPVRLAVDRFEHWHSNLRAIALGLGDLRRIDRYGLTRTGEQYRGFLALEAGNGSAPAERGRELIRQHGGVRQAIMATHPDHGGDAGDFAAVQAAREADAS